MCDKLKEAAIHVANCDTCWEALIAFAKVVSELPEGRVFELVDNYSDEWMEVKK